MTRSTLWANSGRTLLKRHPHSPQALDRSQSQASNLAETHLERSAHLSLKGSQQGVIRKKQLKAPCIERALVIL